MRSIREIKDEIDALLDDVEAIRSLAEKEEREFSEDEQNRWDEVMGEDGLHAQALAELDRAEKHDRELKALAAARRAQNQPPVPFAGTSIDANGNTPQQPVVQHRIGKLRAFSGDNGARDAYDCGTWLKALLGYTNGQRDEQAEARCAARGWDIRATATEGSPTAGGYLVPTPLSNAIIDVRQLAGVSRQLARVVPMTSDTLDIAKKTGGTTVYYPGEAGSVTASDQTFGNIALNAKKRAILSYVSQELVDDAVIAIIDDLASQMGLDLAVQEDNEFINGDQTSTYGGEQGIKNAIGSAAVATAESGEDTWDELDLEDFTAAMGLLDSKYWQRGVQWLCSAQFYHAVMLRVMAESGGNTIQTLTDGASGRPQFLGVPVYFSNQCTTATAADTIHAYFGSFMDAAVIGDRMGVRIAQSSDYAFNTDRLAIRATTRYDINVHDAGDSSTVGAITAVKTNS